jgi:hypothetical protein
MLRVPLATVEDTPVTSLAPFWIEKAALVEPVIAGLAQSILIL